MLRSRPCLSLVPMRCRPKDRPRRQKHEAEHMLAAGFVVEFQLLPLLPTTSSPRRVSHQNNPATPCSIWNLRVASMRLGEHYATLCSRCLEEHNLAYSVFPANQSSVPGQLLPCQATMEPCNFYRHEIANRQDCLSMSLLLLLNYEYDFSLILAMATYLGDRRHEKQVRRDIIRTLAGKV